MPRRSPTVASSPRPRATSGWSCGDEALGPAGVRVFLRSQLNRLPFPGIKLIDILVHNAGGDIAACTARAPSAATVPAVGDDRPRRRHGHLPPLNLLESSSARRATRPGRSGFVRFSSSCQIHHSYGGVWG